jgi:hypothetical protein
MELFGHNNQLGHSVTKVRTVVGEQEYLFTHHLPGF